MFKVISFLKNVLDSVSVSMIFYCSTVFILQVTGSEPRFPGLEFVIAIVCQMVVLLWLLQTRPLAPLFSNGVARRLSI